ncbi:MAG: membrane-fusion-like protein, partial [Acidobacteriota bacterium]
MKGLLKFLAVCVVLGGLGLAGWTGFSKYQQVEKTQAALAQARFGEFLAIVRCRGELKADRSVQIYVPFVPNLRIAWIAAAGELVKEGDAVVRYDTTSGQQDVIQKEAALRQIQASLDQAKAQITITAEHDQADLVDGGYQVELAKIKTSANEFLPRIDAERNLIDLETAEQKLRQLQASVAQHKVSDQSKLANLQRQMEQATAEVDLVKTRMSRLEMVAPVTGYWIVNSNYSGTTSQPFKVGDPVSAGLNLAVIPDMSSLMLDVKVEEID